MKWMRRVVIVVLLLAAGLVAAGMLTALGTDKPVGFQVLQAADSGGRPFAVAVWHPTQARPRPTTLLGLRVMNVAPDAPVAGQALPLIVLSHGNGGGPGSHVDLALALANAGYVVAAPMHRGDNYADQSAAGSANLFGGRSDELHATVDFMLKAWPAHGQIDAARIGAYGFSAGAFTVLAAVGAEPDLRKVAPHCAAQPEFVCEALRAAGSPLVKTAGEQGGSFVKDARIKAAVIAAPGLVFTVAPDSLAGIQVPLQLWSGEQDRHTPYASNAALVRTALGERVEFHTVAGAGHTAFLAPCGLIGPPALCQDAGGFDRSAFHATMNTAILDFFRKHLPGQG
ncbi:alpha/beta hydrolase family protein [Massilia yuzhufengensis]|uniref:Predicted dienelactone hydrolase n=1 Tax=Massilia yuzhufengensis TaxID=1164594 RepID=A0A1I1QL57_9BURK|nr:prolyl oligopeptidase family serine peptidase [Massilia yuzhufengensis]SFD18830.1 Predicted dienelactone hydrolase [Massilia yuzhufengensis]